MKNIIFIALLVLLIQGCSSIGMFTAKHNGKQYWNPGNCDRYQYYYSDMDKVYCLKDGVRTGVVLEPMTNEQVMQVQRSRQANSQSLQQGIQNFNNSLNSMSNSSNQIYNDSMRQMNDANRNFNNSNDKKYYYMQQTAPNLYYIK